MCVATGKFDPDRMRSGKTNNVAQSWLTKKALLAQCSGFDSLQELALHTIESLTVFHFKGSSNAI